jgi:hypothetical protein
MRSGQGGPERLAQAGLVVRTFGDKTTVQSVRFGSEAAKYRLTTGDEIVAALAPAERMSRFWFTLPALVLFAAIIMLQRRRKRVQPALAVAH